MIPNQINYIYFPGTREFSLIHHLAIASARRANPAADIVVHCEVEPTTTWWDATRDLVSVVNSPRPTEVFGVPLLHAAHQTDVLRLNLLLQHGGIFLDLDVVCLRPFTPLLEGRCVLAKQDAAGRKGLGCAVILAEAGSPFVRRWLDGYDPERSRWEGFRSKGADRYWAEMSTRYPAMLAEDGDPAVTVLDHAAFYPFGFGGPDLAGLFGEQRPVPPESFCFHLWEQRSWEPYLCGLTVQDVLSAESTFSASVRDLLPAA